MSRKFQSDILEVTAASWPKTSTSIHPEDTRMTETVKKPRTTKPKAAPSTNGTGEAKPRKATAKKTAGSTQPTLINGAGPTHEQIADLARKYWAQRGYVDGHHEEDWHRAERELRAKAS